MLTPTSMLSGMGMDKEVALLTDGRFSGATRGAAIGLCLTGGSQPGTHRRLERRRHNQD